MNPNSILFFLLALFTIFGIYIVIRNMSVSERSLPQIPSEKEEAKPPVVVEEWKEKYDRLQNLFQEKSAELEKTQSQLESEISHRKDFNKIKDILEKELADTKDKLKNLQTELSTFNQDAALMKERPSTGAI